MPQKIPTFVGIVLTIFIVGVIAFFVEQVIRIPSNATGSKEPRNIQVTNISDTSFSVSWLTTDPATGLISVETSEQRSTPVYDDRDVTKKLGLYTTHSTVFRNATPNTQYWIKILSNGQTYPQGTPLSIRTGPVLPTDKKLGTLEPAYGTIMTAANGPASGALVYLTLEDGQTLSAVTGKSGTWLIPLNITRTKQLNAYMTPSNRMTETIQVYLNTDQTTAITDTLNDSPVPDMILGKSYDFRKQQAKTEGTPVAVAATTPTVLGDQTKNYIVLLESPADGAALTFTRPLFQGTGIPGKSIKIFISPNPTLSDSIVVESDGTWTYTPPRALGEGDHTVTITSLDQQNKNIKISHTFKILKSGTQVLGDATPSATLSPTIEPTPLPTMESSPIPEPTPTPMALIGKSVPTSGNGPSTIGLIVITGGLTLLLLGLAF